MKTIVFSDAGQDFTHWTINARGKVIKCAPAQSWVWVGGVVTNHRSLKVGGLANWRKGQHTAEIRYPITKVTKGGAK